MMARGRGGSCGSSCSAARSVSTSPATARDDSRPARGAQPGCILSWKVVRWGRASALGLLVVLAAAPGASARSSFGPFFTPADDAPHVKVLSNRADLVSGGDALVQIAPPVGVDPAHVRADLDGRDVTDAFATRADGHFYGLVSGLKDGPNVLTAQLPDGSGARLTITNHPIGGPVFAGPQVQPWICTNADQGLGKPTDAQCDTPAVFSYAYKDATTGQFNDYDPKSPPPDGQVATTTTDDGRTVPYIVRTE